MEQHTSILDNQQLPWFYTFANGLRQRVSPLPDTGSWAPIKNEVRQDFVESEDKILEEETEGEEESDEQEYISLKPRKIEGSIRVKLFKGLLDGSEDAEEYLDDVEFLALSWASSSNGNEVIREKNTVRAFHQNLDPSGDVSYWWNFILKAEEKRAGWESVKKAFLEQYASSPESGQVLFNLQNEILAITQGPSESILEYIHCIERISKQTLETLNSMLAMSFVKGLRDEHNRREVSFVFRDETKFTFTEVLSCVKVSYREIGKPDPFRLQEQKGGAPGIPSMVPHAILPAMVVPTIPGAMVTVASVSSHVSPNNRAGSDPEGPLNLITV